ncbi:MAG: hypothetical protein ACRD0K_13740 [Egibacteraceae bacterium]
MIITPIMIAAVALVVAGLIFGSALLRPMLRQGGLTLAAGGLHPSDSDPIA